MWITTNRLPIARRTYIRYRDRLKIALVVSLVSFGSFYYISADEEEVIYSGRKRKKILTKNFEDKLGEYFKTMVIDSIGPEKLITEHVFLDRITYIGNRICDANQLERRNFYLVQSHDINSFSLIGNNIFISTGILPYLWTDSSVAMVLAHEIAHEAAKHHSDRYLVYPFAVLSFVVHGWIGLSLFQVLYYLPKCRFQELEADKIGLYLMAKAQYDTDDGVNLYRLFARAIQRGVPNSFSSHPDWVTRAERLQHLRNRDPLISSQRGSKKIKEPSVVVEEYEVFDPYYPWEIRRVFPMLHPTNEKE